MKMEHCCNSVLAQRLKIASVTNEVWFDSMEVTYASEDCGAREPWSDPYRILERKM